MTETVNGRWVQTRTDGLGRTIKVRKGTGATSSNAVSVVDTEYAPCACSPMGKVKRVSTQYAEPEPPMSGREHG